MFFKSSEIPNNFNRIAEISDNYIVFVKENNLMSNTNYEAYIQFINPSFICLFTENYKIKSGTSYSYNVNYINNGMYSFIDSIDSEFNLNTIQVDSDLFSELDSSRGDYINIFLGQILVCICILWVAKQLTRLVYKGGL